MKYEYPANHGLSDSIITHLGFKDESTNTPALTDVQYEALKAGIGRGQSALVVSPTSTGKTQIAIWAVSKSLETGCNTVYLVTHRALAKQKFDDFKKLLMDKFLYGEGTALGIATGDYIRNADGDAVSKPLELPLLVATYEKYLALLSAAGVPVSMKNTVVVCDEVQLISEKNRGQNVEILLTLLRNAGWKQFVGLSAVLNRRDAENLAGWLGVSAIVQSAREKHLKYECWTRKGISSVSTEFPDNIESNLPLPPNCSPETIPALAYLMGSRPSPLPIIVFCMRKKDIYDFSEILLNKLSKSNPKQQSLAFDGLPETAANAFLSKSMAYRIGIHNADLTDDERRIVEESLLNDNLDVVFATTTLAAGVNFPLGAAIFASWTRWDKEMKAYVPIETGEFHNMAGRVGRMGHHHDQGRIVFFANGIAEIMNAKQYLDLGTMPALEPRISPQRFNQLALQLVCSGLCTTEAEIERLIFSTFSALIEQDKNSKAFLKWPILLSNAITELLSHGLLIKTSSGILTATSVGKAVSYSGLLPETGVFLLRYMKQKGNKLEQYLPSPGVAGDMDRLAYLVFCACFSSPEFRPTCGKPETRSLPWPLNKDILFDADIYREELPEPVWRADLYPINASKITIDWINGLELSKLEGKLPDLSAGVLKEMFRYLVWTLQGFASVVAAATDPRNPPHGEFVSTSISGLNKFPRIIRRLSYRVAEGLPDDVLWMTSLNLPGEPFHVLRHEVVTLRKLGYSAPEQVMLSSPEASKARVDAFAKAKPTPEAKANWLRDASRNWKQKQRKRKAEKHLKRAKSCPHFGLVESYYDSKGTEFELVFEKALTILNIEFKKLDTKGKIGAPDYALLLSNSPPIVMELKSREGDRLVDYNKAVEVLSASEIHGYKDAFCVTLCHPGVDPSVPSAIASCGRLSVVESADLAEALLRMCAGELSQEQLWQWLASPGQALVDDLPFSQSQSG